MNDNPSEQLKNELAKKYARDVTGFVKGHKHDIVKAGIHFKTCEPTYVNYNSTCVVCNSEVRDMCICGEDI